MMRGPARASTSTLVVHIGPLAGFGVGDVPSLAGLVVGRAVGGAVTRNRIKRRLRHIVWPLLDDLPDGWGIVVRALPEAADASFQVLDRDVRSALRRCLDRVGQRPETPVGVSR